MCSVVHVSEKKVYFNATDPRSANQNLQAIIRETMTARHDKIHTSVAFLFPSCLRFYSSPSLRSISFFLPSIFHPYHIRARKEKGENGERRKKRETERRNEQKERRQKQK
jgi:hypothetical protein